MGTLSGQKFDQTKYNQVKFNMLKNLKKLISKYGPDAEKVVHGRALKTALNSTNMKENKIREMIEDALKNPKKADINKDNKLSNYEKKRGAAIEKAMVKKNKDQDAKSKVEEASVFDPMTTDELSQDIANNLHKASFLAADVEPTDSMLLFNIKNTLGPLHYRGLNEDIDLGHQDDEPGMLKADLYKIGKYAMELYQMMDDLENTGQEIDFPHWWQSKIVRATSMISSAKHYLEFELKEPQVDAMVDVASEEDMIDEKLTAKTPMKKYIKDFAKSDAPQFKGKSKEKKRQMAVAAKLSAENPTNAPMMEGEIDKADILSGELYKLKGKIQDAFFDKIRKFINMGSYEDAEYLLNRVKGQMKEKAVAAKLSAENPNEGLAEIILNKLKNR
jgi:hypothetical protein